MPLTYPVDLNEKYSLWDTNTGAIYENDGRPVSGRNWPNGSGEQVKALSDNLQWLLDVRDPKPAFDPATQKAVRLDPVADLVAETYTYGWQVVALTQEELDELARQADIDAREAQAKAIYAALDAGTATSKQAQKVLAWLLKREFTDVG